MSLAMIANVAVPVVVCCCSDCKKEATKKK